MSTDLDYSKYPGEMASRRFELITDDTVDGYGVKMHGGMCLTERHGSSEYDRMLGFATIEHVQQKYHIRWIDPPFQRVEGGDGA